VPNPAPAGRRSGQHAKRIESPGEAAHNKDSAAIQKAHDTANLQRKSEQSPSNNLKHYAAYVNPFTVSISTVYFSDRRPPTARIWNAPTNRF